MWKCVKCEMNNPDHSGSCFICGTEKSYSLRLAEEMKKRVVPAEKKVGKRVIPAADVIPHESAGKSSEPTDAVKDDIFGDAVYTRTHEPHMEKFSVPEETSPAEKSDSSELYEEDDDFLYELKKEQQEKRSKKIKEIFVVIALIILIVLIIAAISESDDGYETEPETADTVSIETTDETKYIIVKDV